MSAMVPRATRSHARCHQENLIQQLKNGVRALHVPVNTLLANWAFIVMASLAWSALARLFVDDAAAHVSVERWSTPEVGRCIADAA